MPPLPPTSRSRRGALLAAALAGLLTGCATHRGTLPKAPPFPAATWKPSIAVQVERVYAEADIPGLQSFNHTAGMLPMKSLQRMQEAKDQVQLLKRLQASGLFSRVVSMRRNDRLPPAPNELEQMARLGDTDISLIVEPDMASKLLPPFNGAVILFIIPSYQVDSYQLVARARFAGPGKERRYQLNDEMGTLYWLPLLPMLVTRQADRMALRLNDNLLDTLILRLYEEAAQGQVFPPATASALPALDAAGKADAPAAPQHKAPPAPDPAASAPLTPPGPAPAVSP